MILKMTTQKHQYHLDIRIEKLAPMKIAVTDTITAGLDPRSDLVLTGAKIKNHHLAFHKKGENLALHYLGNTNQTFLNSLPLEEGKVYLLEPGDKVQLSGVEIIIRHELVHVSETPKSQKVVFNSLSDLKPESVQEGLLFADNPTGSLKDAKHIQEPILKKLEKEMNKGEYLSLLVIKIYSLLTDFFFTYLTLVTLLPLVYVNTYAIEIINYISSYAFPAAHHSFFKFFTAWYLFSFVQTMIFGTTVGQFLLGLKNKNESTYGKLILFRMKTLFFSLFLLPAQNQVSDKLFFKGIRKLGIVVILLFILFSPLFLPPPYNKSVTLLKDATPLERELRTTTIRSASKSLMINLHAELSPRYMFLPFVYKDSSKRTFEFIDLKTNQKILIYEDEQILYDELDRLLEYGNPFYSTLHKAKLEELSIKKRKELLENIITLSPLNLSNAVTHFGPFFGSALLLKERLLNNVGQVITNDTVAKFYTPETPLIFIGSSQQDYFYLLGPNGLSRFVIDSIKRGPLVSLFEEEIFSKLLFDSEIVEVRNNQQVGILEAQDAFLHGDEHTLLTYYVGIVNSLNNQKIMHDNTDLTDMARAAVRSNVEVIQKFVKDKNVYRSFEDIKNQLTPMENPGEKR